MARKLPPLVLESEAWGRHLTVCGVDEAGRGPLFGPLVVGSVVLTEENINIEAYDSKALAPARRAQLAETIKREAAAWGAGVVSAEEIDKLGMSESLKLASQRAINSMGVNPDFMLIDGKHNFTGVEIPHVMLVKGEEKSRSIAAASIIAKTTRDELTDQLSVIYPGYGIERHKGYGTKEHLARIAEIGPCPEHRWSFAPICRSRD